MTHEELYESKSQMKRVEILKTGEKQMTHDELLAKIDDGVRWTCTGDAVPWDALRAVVELARKYEEFDGVDSAGMGGYRLAMKQIIQAIEKELK